MIPFSDLRLPGEPHHVSLPRPHVIEIGLADGRVEEVPWDFARHYVDEDYQARSEHAAERGRRLFGTRLRALRSQRRLSQEALSKRSGINRVTITRIEAGEQLPRYQTILALADALDVSIERLLVD